MICSANCSYNLPDPLSASCFIENRSGGISSLLIFSCDIKFKDIPVTVYGDGQSKNITKTVINIIVDPGNVFEGNLYNVKGESYSYMTLKQTIGETLDKVLSINVSEFMSPYTYEVYIVNTKRV